MKPITFIIIFLLLFSCRLPGQDTLQPAPFRPKLGLVLSGGGAKGLAHVGVLKVLEEAGLRPDYITGTSMGSIIGGLYAIGYSADSLEQLIRAQDWDRVLSDNIELRDVVFEEKPFFRNEFIELPFEQWVVKPPSGAINGQQIEQLLSELALPAFAIEDFRKLPIPFLCIGADIVNGQFVLLDKGYLPDAMRTSMAIPTIFTPISNDTTILIDGGLIRNFPVQEVKDMGADIIIGVYTGAFQQSETELQSFSSILSQAGFLLSIRDAKAQMPLIDIYLEPDLTGLSAADFKKHDAIMQAGENAARLKIDALKRLADSLDQIAPSIPPPSLELPDSITIHRMEVIGNQNVSFEEIIRRTSVRPGDRVAPTDLKRVVEHLYGSNLFEKVTYRMQRQDDRNTLYLRFQEKNQNLLRTSLLYNSYHNAGLLFSFTFRNALGSSSRLMVIGRFSENYEGRINYLKYFGKDDRSSFFTQFSVRKDEFPIYNQGVVESQYRLLESPLDIRLQRRFGLNTMVGGGIVFNTIEGTPLAGRDARIFEKINYKTTNLYLNLQHNSFNRNVFPTKGALLKTELSWFVSDNLSFALTDQPVEHPDSLLGTGSYQKLLIDLQSFIPVHSKASIKINPYAGVIFNARNTFSEFFLVGGPERVSPRSLPFYGLEPNELAAQIAVGFNIGFQQFLSDNMMTSLDFNGMLYGYPDLLETVPGPENFLAGLGLSFGYRTIAGPFKVSFTLPFDTNNQVSSKLRTYLSFGYQF